MLRDEMRDGAAKGGARAQDGDLRPPHEEVRAPPWRHRRDGRGRPGRDRQGGGPSRGAGLRGHSGAQGHGISRRGLLLLGRHPCDPEETEGERTGPEALPGREGVRERASRRRSGPTTASTGDSPRPRAFRRASDVFQDRARPAPPTRASSGFRRRLPFARCTSRSGA